MPSGGARPCAVNCQCKRHVSWSKGLRKETDERIAEKGRRSGQARKGKVTVWNKGVTGYKAPRQPGYRCPEGCSCRRHTASFDYARTFLTRKPTKPEMALLELASPYGFEYVGNGQFLIETKNPDFWDGKTRLLEMFGDYWHKGEDPQGRIDFFKDRGYECLVVWEYELKDTAQVVERIATFAGSGR